MSDTLEPGYSEEQVKEMLEDKDELIKALRDEIRALVKELQDCRKQA